MTTFPIRMRAGFACRVADLDRVSFNDAATSGALPCVPPAVKGSARLFSEEDLLPLYLYARLKEFGFPARLAGHLACEAAERARADYAEPADRIIFVRGTMGSFVALSKIREPATGEIKPGYDPEHETPTEDAPQGRHYGVGTVIFAIEFYVAHVRRIIAERIARERSILGESDDD